jgi:DNA polymerase III epsilon subunit-like protein
MSIFNPGSISAAFTENRYRARYMQFPSFKFTVLDTETTGFVPKIHHIIEFASMRIENGELAEEYEELFYAEEVPPIVEVLTRIKTSSLKEKKMFADRCDRILAAIGPDTLIVGQNVGFDLGMLKGHGIDLTDRPWIDTSMLASLVFPELESYSLGYLSSVLNLDHHPVHRALGDVRATLELLGKCWERLQELPEELLAPVREIMQKSSPGYRMLFEALPPSIATSKPIWLDALRTKEADADYPITMKVDVSAPAAEHIALIEEPLDPAFLGQALQHALSSTHRYVIAVKNLEASMQRLPPLKDVQILYPPFLLMDEAAAKELLKQDIFTADEATLAAKLHWYKPRTRGEMPLHGGEEAVWSGKLCTTSESETYLMQLKKPAKVTLLDHRQLLMLAKNPPEGGEAFFTDLHVIIDDASMLEDTATKAFGTECSIDTLRAAAEGNELLTRFTDLLQIWIEKIRNNQDLRYLAPNDLESSESKGLRAQLEDLQTQQWSAQIQSHLRCIATLLDPQTLDSNIAYIEQRMNGSQFLHSAPESISTLLKEVLFTRFPTTLFVPGQSSGQMEELIPSSFKTALGTVEPPSSCRVEITCSAEPTLYDIISSPPEGKTIMLLPSKGAIEQVYVKYTEELEEQGVTLICQGVSGGQGRMQAEFIAATGKTIWLITPWTFEGIDLPANTADHLIIQALPFDHPSQPVLSRRAAKYQDSFNQYMMPRLRHRLFRLLRTFCRIRSQQGDVRIIDERLHSKAYGKALINYLKTFTPEGEGLTVGTPMSNAKPKSLPKKPVQKKKDDTQLPLF